MNPTSHAIMHTVASSDATLSPAERALLQNLLTGHSAPAVAGMGAPLLLTRKDAARMLSVSRVTLWRMTRDSLLHPVEIMPGTSRYRLEEIEAFARRGMATMPPKTKTRGVRLAVVA